MSWGFGTVRVLAYHAQASALEAMWSWWKGLMMTSYQQNRALHPAVTRHSWRGCAFRAAAKCLLVSSAPYWLSFAFPYSEGTADTQNRSITPIQQSNKACYLFEYCLLFLANPWQILKLFHPRFFSLQLRELWLGEGTELFWQGFRLHGWSVKTNKKNTGLFVIWRSSQKHKEIKVHCLS